MAGGEKANDLMSFHGSAKRNGDERGERTEWTSAGVVLMLMVLVASTVPLIEVVLSVLARLSTFSF